MLEEFRRRNMTEDFYQLSKENYHKERDASDQVLKPFQRQDGKKLNKNRYIGEGPERFFEADKDEVFDGREFTLIFIDSDSVTNVTTLNRVNQRRVLIFCGNGNGLIAFGKGKAEDYENAFDHAFKKMRTNLVCLSLDNKTSSPKIMDGRHNDFRIKIWP